MRRIWGKRGAGEVKEETYRRKAFVLVVTGICALTALFSFAGGAGARVSDTSTAAPTITSDLPDYTPGSTVTISGANWQPQEAVHIFANDDAGQTWSYNGDVTADDAGGFTTQFQLPNWFVANYSVTATGSSGSIATTGFTDANVANLQGPSSPTNSTSATFTWTVQGGGTTTTECSIDSTTAFSSCISPKTYSGLVDGSHTVRVRITGANNSDSWTWTIDSTPPAVPTAISPADNGLTNDTTPTFTWSSVSDATGVSYTLEYGPRQTNCSAASFTTTVSGLTTTSFTPVSSIGADGSYCWHVKAVDGAANSSAFSAAPRFTLDTVAPARPVVTGTTPTSPSASTNPSINGTADAGSTVNIYTNSTCTSAVTGTGTAATGSFSIQIGRAHV